MTISCKYCGKQIEVPGENTNRLYCSESCKKKAYRAKKNGGFLVDQSKPRIQPEQCGKCQYGTKLENFWCCGYFEIMGHTRTSLHPEGLTSHCYEFTPKKRGRGKRGIRLHRPLLEGLEDEEDYG